MPFTHTYNPAEQSLEISSRKRVGRWPGVVAIWQASAGRLAPRFQRPWNWLLYGKQAETRVFFPAVTMTFEAAARPFPETTGGGRLMEAVFGHPDRMPGVDKETATGRTAGPDPDE